MKERSDHIFSRALYSLGLNHLGLEVIVPFRFHQTENDSLNNPW